MARPKKKVTKALKKSRSAACFFQENQRIVWIIMICILTFALVSFIQSGPNADEGHHYEIIKRIKQFLSTGEPFELTHPTLPGYHALQAVLASLFLQLFIFATQLGDVAFYRLVSFLIGVTSIVLFSRVTKKINKTSSCIKTVQYCFFPIIFPFFFLIYTDVFSVLSVLLMFYLLLKKDYLGLGFAGLLSIAVRQNNVIWVAFVLALIYIRGYGWKPTFKNMRAHFRQCWSLYLAIVLFCIFVIINGGIAIGDKWAHPAFSFHPGNIYLLLFLFFFLFLPLNIHNLPKIYNLLRKHPVLLPLTIIATILCIATFVNDHPWNQAYALWWSRNRILVFADSLLLGKIIFFIPIAYTVLSLLVTKLYRAEYYLLYPFTILYLAPSWLIEPRYLFIPFVLFLLFKRRDSNLVEYGTTLMFFVLSLVIFWGVSHWRFML